MNGVSYPANHEQTRLPAKLLFSAHDLRQYCRWQTLYTPLKTSEQGFVTTAFEYEEFRQWLSKQDSGYFSDVFEDIASHITPTPSKMISTLDISLASVCRHAVHPVPAALSRSRCPVCTIEVHLNYVRVLFQSLEGTTERPLPGTASPSDRQKTLYYAWLRGKMDALHQLSELESLAIEELNWSERHDEIRCEGMKTAKEALEVYWNEISGCSSEKEESKEKRKSVSFAADTDFGPGRHADYFLQRSPRYEHGKYTIRNEEPDIDTSVSEDSEDYSDIMNCMVSEPSSEWTEDITEIFEDGSQQLGGADRDYSSGDDDSDWTDIDSDDYEPSDGGYICFEAEEETSFIVFSNE